jgi:tRNA threonylcarbamoyladenosine biosynthesis protein TsaB
VIVALEAASADQSVAVADTRGGLLAQTSWTAPRGQGGELLPRLLALLSDRHASLTDVSAVAVGIGPGSFTGLRVALALAKGLAMGLDRPIVGVPSLEAWLAAVPDATAALARAGAAEVYALARTGVGDGPQVILFSALSDDARRMTTVAPAELAAALTLGHAAPPTGAAAAIAKLAADRLAAGEPDELAALEPVYLRPPRGLAEMTEGTVTWL